ncbi:MAG TPA: MaoC family dehydratase [Stellaceae bacterium]
MAEPVERGNFFEDFRLGQVFDHATPRTVGAGDAALYLALTGSRFAVNCSDPFAQDIGYRSAPLDDVLVFNLVFGKSVPDISLNAIANLGYADCRFGAPVYPGDTLRARSRIIGLRENANRKSGIAYVRTRGENQRGEAIVDYVRWVMVAKRDPAAAAPPATVPDLPAAVGPEHLIVPADLDLKKYDRALAGSSLGFDDYAVGARIDHGDGMTIEEAEHALATRLYQNSARVHFDAHRARAQAGGPAKGRRLVYGGHVISLARAASFNGLANAFHIAAINGGRHVAPTVAGDTIYAWSAVLAKAALPGRTDLGALRLRTIAARDRPCADFPDRTGDADDPALVLDLDYWVLMPR